MMITCLRLPTHWPPSQIETRYSNEDIEKISFEIISHIKNTFDCCIDQDEVIRIRIYFPCKAELQPPPFRP